jgi:hypothetical protein
MLDRRTSLLWLISVGSLSFAFYYALPRVMSAIAPYPPTRTVFLEAKQRWQARPFSAYRFLFVHDTGTHSCAYQVEIQDERVISVEPAKTTSVQKANPSCPQQPTVPVRSISQLFNQIQPYATEWTCGPNGCECDRLEVSATYNTQWGYPETVVLRQVAPLWWKQMEKGLGLPSCTLIGVGGPLFQVENLTPLGKH